MDTTDQKFSSFSCEVRIFQAKNVEFPSPKNLFVRYYLSAGNNKRIPLSTKQITSTSDFTWNESFSLECLGSEDCIHSLKQASVVFELRRAKTLPFVGRVSGSQLLGRAEIPWEEVFESANMGIEKWACLVCGGALGLWSKQPKLKVGMRVRVGEEMEMEKKRRRKWNNNNNIDECCGYKSHNMGHCVDHDVFAIAAAMEFL